MRKTILLIVLLFWVAVSYAVELININTADLYKLVELKGIGKSKAQAIINYRKLHGPYPSVSALIQVKGIGKSILQNNRNKMTVD